ncbi:hypothetical protein CGCF415_v005403 [Colletotrichum fructicola]|uniref:TLC domain-containing protein n=1 Tax=Colletotrichum fructicola (strain Nara gc5) TaxID=1213859 RepID=L2FWK9_COLFN|nr:uncharacterized protein CGMCC3_g14271 [Colletotrichum fructicola]KAF4476933.1 hypothetical protein CGGC5_v015411 [Colletotrichum fructicola Nara gc5]KAI8282739.1 hypothetical protein K4K60_003279 [Colletotrichum sp. SAR11_57]KAE9569709.1 hypothetical protein CGMCC3_g14271 [Colletotrichum fructicola]KAF4426823.1 hypothetical protein CFRS1_v003399 [Colletotrichum fructicola]KAF4900439.1 hypothetical protein CGCFRS4_v003333 [Colletotrichum fructicola]
MSPSDLTCILMGLAGYQFLNRLSHYVVKHCSPSFYAALEKDRSSKLAPYFVFPLGILLTLVSTPICLHAYSNTPQDTDTFGVQRPFTTTGKICLASRGILWVSELPLLAYSPEYVTHHVLSLASLLLVLVRSMPRRPIYLIYAGLITELFSDNVALLRLHGRHAGSSLTFRRAMLANVVGMVLLRILPIVFFTAGMKKTSPDYMGGIVMYCVYLLRLSFLQLKILGLIKGNLDQGTLIPILGKRARQALASWMPRPKALVFCAAVTIVLSSAIEYFAGSQSLMGEV